ncbi:MAG: TonB-dependent receptor [Moraxella sp.]|nr:TonB-dependent receptor [Moraxella sp.]
MSNSVLRQAILVALSPSILLPAIAQTSPQQEPTTILDPLVITASKSSQLLSQTPASLTVINSEQINQNPTLNLSDIVKQDASIYIKQNGGIGQGATLSLRGTNPNHTLLLKDGIRLNTPNTLTPTYPETLDLSDIGRVEILKGPASVQYGSDAIGGVVHLISKTPSRTGAKLTGLYGENNTHKAIVNGDWVHNGFFASITGQKFKTDGSPIFNTQGQDKKAGFEQEGYHAKLGYDNNKLTTSLTYSQNEGINTYNEYGQTDNTAKRHFENSQAKFIASYDLSEKLNVSAHHAQAKDRQKYVETWSSNEFNTDYTETDIHAHWKLMPHHTLLLGATKTKTDYQDAYAYTGSKSIDSTGYYAQMQYDTDALDGQVGIRLEDNEKFGNHTVGQGAIRYHFSPTTSVYANIGSAFRAPSLNELYYYSVNSWGTTLGNETLEPEESISYEIGATHQLHDNLNASLSAYQTDVKNLIATTFDSTKNATTYENLNKAQFKGGELGVKYNYNDYYASLNYAYTDSENKNTGLPIAYRPKQTGTATLGYDNGTAGVSATVIARGRANADNSSNPVQVAGYTTLDVNAHWYITDHVKLFSSIQNIGNVQSNIVYNFGNWYINGGRQANVGVTFSY